MKISRLDIYLLGLVTKCSILHKWSSLAGYNLVVVEEISSNKANLVFSVPTQGLLFSKPFGKKI